jgi:hypothetical protein
VVVSPGTAVFISIDVVYFRGGLYERCAGGERMVEFLQKTLKRIFARGRHTERGSPAGSDTIRSTTA